MRLSLVAPERRGRRLTPSEGGGAGGEAGECAESGSEINKAAGDIAHGSGFDYAGPAHDARDAEAAFVEGEFEATQAAGAVEEMWGMTIGVVGAVVAGEDDESVGGEGGMGVNGSDDAADIAVEF